MGRRKRAGKSPDDVVTAAEIACWVYWKSQTWCFHCHGVLTLCAHGYRHSFSSFRATRPRPSSLGRADVLEEADYKDIKILTGLPRIVSPDEYTESDFARFP